MRSETTMVQPGATEVNVLPARSPLQGGAHFEQVWTTYRCESSGVPCQGQRA
jgi:hypothetical protein